MFAVCQTLIVRFPAMRTSPVNRVCLTRPLILTEFVWLFINNLVVSSYEWSAVSRTIIITILPRIYLFARFSPAHPLIHKSTVEKTIQESYSDLYIHAFDLDNLNSIKLLYFVRIEDRFIGWAINKDDDFYSLIERFGARFFIRTTITDMVL